VALLLDRQDAGAGLMRAGEAVTPLPERPVGTVADACRRALGLATAPAPPSTLELWTLAWLDRLVEVAAGGGGRARLGTWAQVAGLHAAVGPLTGTAAGASGPGALAASARALAGAWPWARLRADPRVVPLPGGPPSAALATWMDDGMWARWLLGRFPAVDDLVTAVHALLPAVLAEGVDRVVRAARA
jgi:hypothetical protein